jgi:hypothetical protein
MRAAISVALGTLVIAACAGTPPNAITPPATALAAPSPALATAAPNARADARDAGAAGISPELAGTARRLGYQAKMAGKTIVYCQRVMLVGSHMSEETCIDATHFDAVARAKQRQEDDARKLLNELQQRGDSYAPGGNTH